MVLKNINVYQVIANIKKKELDMIVFLGIYQSLVNL